MKNRKCLLLFLLLALLVSSLFVLSSCSEDEPTELPKIEGVIFNDVTYEYDGTEKEIKVSGLPAGASVVYEPTNKFMLVGNYSVTAVVTLEGYETLRISATLKITEKVVDTSVTVTFDGNGATKNTIPATAKTEQNTPIAEPTGEIEKKGYTFGGWYLGDKKWSFKTAVTEPITLTAKWILADYEIAYRLYDGENHPDNPTEYTITSEEFVLKSPTPPTASEFLYWYIITGAGETPVTTIPTAPDGAGDLVLHAKYNYFPQAITYELDGGTNNQDNPQSSNYGNGAITLLDASKRGYDFVGWYTDSAKTQSITQIPAKLSSPMTVYAKFELTTYNINYTNIEDSENTALTSLGAERSYQITTPTITLKNLSDRAYYTFDGWYIGNDKVTEIPTDSMGDITLSAKWLPKEYNISYMNLADGTNNSANPAKFNYETPTFQLLAPTRANYDFLGWYDAAQITLGQTNGNKIESIAVNTHDDITVYAHWKATEYNITYLGLESADNSLSNTGKYSIVSHVTFADPVKPGYKFLGWYDAAQITEGTANGTRITSTTGKTGAITVYAQWKALDCSITYDANGGTLPTGEMANPSGYDLGVGVPAFNDARKDGAHFLGWYDTDNNCYIKAIPTDAEGSYNLKAMYAYGSEGLVYSTDKTTVIGYNGNDTVVYIPANYVYLENGTETTGPNIVKIAAGAFNNAGIVRIVLPETITTIEANAFSGCTALESLYLYNSVATVAADAFAGTAITEIKCQATAKPAGFADGYDDNGAGKITFIWGIRPDGGVNTPIIPL